ncbi:HLH domain-containing protein [Oryctes borbonicus]|uniref:HLH domain-containing protein n=1 Tax=Oryctes borbonicus TaxID=1629725 RepID=A0A0T6B929_9SCAR|nr:HLH domain-containing protein [Oryctes borbonicus]
MDRLNYSESVELRTKHELKSLFDEVDTDENGYISHRELRDFLSTNNHKLPQHVLDKVYKRADRNGDGRLDLREFIGMVYDPKNRDFFSNLFNTCLNKYIYFVLPPPPAIYRRSISEDRRDKYGKLIKCYPPPLFMIAISLMEIMLFAVDAFNGDTTATGDVAQMLIFDPKKRPQAWRYITYMLVHVRYAHLIMNLLIQILLGIILEVYHRWWRVMLVYSAGVLAGSLGTFVSDSVHQLAGASGGVYSLITAHVATIILNWSEMRFPLSNLTVFFAFVVGDLVLAFQSNDYHISHTAHFCGALAGLLVGVLILRNVSSNRTERIMQLIALIVYIGLMGFAIIWNAVR